MGLTFYITLSGTQIVIIRTPVIMELYRGQMRSSVTLSLGIIGEFETDSRISFLAYDLINDPFLGFSSVTASRKSAGVFADFKNLNFESWKFLLGISHS